MNKKVLLLAVALLLVGLAVGWFAGRSALEREWSDPLGAVTPEAAQRAAVDGADPSPKAGVRVARRLPLRRMRAFLKDHTAGDPAAVVVGSIGRGDKGADVNLVVQNRGACKITRVAGVAYGYDAWGRPAAINKGGEPYVAFEAKDADIEPKKRGQVSMSIKTPGTASLAVAHLDEVACEDGKAWKRP